MHETWNRHRRRGDNHCVACAFRRRLHRRVPAARRAVPDV